MEIAEFLLARIAEDEEAAHGLARAYERDEVGATAKQVMAGALIVPRLALADCDAKRRIVEHLARPMVWIGPGPGDFMPGDHHRPADEYLLRLLAVPYSEHPDYRQEWKP